MLLYHNGEFLRVCLQRYGSVIWRPKSLGLGFICAGVTALFQYLYGMDQERFSFMFIGHPYAMQGLGSIVTFAIVFRTNIGWTRYWEAITELHFMYSKWGDAFAQLCAFTRLTVEEEIVKKSSGSRDKINGIHELQKAIGTDFALLSALAIDRFKTGDSGRMERRCHRGLPWKQRVVIREDMANVRSRRKKSKGSKKDKDEDQDNSYHPSKDLDPDELLMPLFRVQGSAPSSEKIGTEDHAPYTIFALPSAQQHKHLENSADRTTLVMNWIVYKLAKMSPQLNTASPIQSRMYQELSSGMVGFNNCMKIADVPFPFPYAQVLYVLLSVWTCFIPLYVMHFTQSMIAGPIMSFILFKVIWGMNTLATELENPMGSDVNDISLLDFHHRFLLTIQESMSCSRDYALDGEVSLDALAGDTSLLTRSASCGSFDWKEHTSIHEPSETMLPVDEEAPQVLAVDLPGTKAMLETQRRLAVSSDSVSQAAALSVVSVLDQNLAQISRRMEQHLQTMVRELGELTRMSRADGSLGSIGPGHGGNYRMTEAAETQTRSRLEVQLAQEESDSKCNHTDIAIDVDYAPASAGHVPMFLEGRRVSIEKDRP